MALNTSALRPLRAQINSTLSFQRTVSENFFFDIAYSNPRRERRRRAGGWAGGTLNYYLKSFDVAAGDRILLKGHHAATDAEHVVVAINTTD